MSHAADKNLEKFIQQKAFQLRLGALRATTAAQSGHPTSCFSAADLVASLFFHVLRFDYTNPTYHNNDRFILSKGHAIPIVYAALWQRGIITHDQLITLRTFDSELEGHPTPRFVYNEAATGSLGQGLGIGIGMALNARQEKLSYHTYVMLGDGEMAEGSVWEAAELAAHYQLTKITAIVDCNRLGQSDQALHAHNVERYAVKFQAFGWETIVIDGHNYHDILGAFEQARTHKESPYVIIAKTFKGYGLENIEDRNGYHGKPFPKEQLPELEKQLEARFGCFQQTSDLTFKPVLPEQMGKVVSHNPISCPLGQSAQKQLFSRGQKMSTRKAFGYALAALGKADTRVTALDTDVKNSTFTDMFEKESPERFVQCFIAEQNMVNVATGLALRGKIPFAATFGCFFTRAYDQIRMAGIGQVPLRLCGSHAGVSIGQDGPSQMGLEDISMMRPIIDSVILWPSDAVCAYKLTVAMANHMQGISYMKSTRGNMPILYDLAEEFPFGGCKILVSSSQDQACIVAAGITVFEALEAHKRLVSKNVHVTIIDAYSIKPLDVQTILHAAQKATNHIITVEDHYQEGGLGETVASALCGSGIQVDILAVRTMPRSGQPDQLMAFEGIDAASIVAAVMKKVSFTCKKH